MKDDRTAPLDFAHSEPLFQQLADNIDQLAWIARADGWIVWYNRRWYEYTGTQEKDMEGWGWQSVHEPTVLEDVTTHWQSSIDTGEPFNMTFPLRGADGKFQPFLTRVLPLRDTSGLIVAWFGTNTNVSEERALLEERNQLLMSERAARDLAESVNREKDHFIATVSHELRTPLNAISGWIQLAKANMDDKDLLEEAIHVIERNVKNQVALIDELLDLNRIINGIIHLHFEPVDPVKCITSAIDAAKPLAAAKEIDVAFKVEGEIGPILADESRLNQIVGNLLSNALKFTPKHGSVEVSLATIEDEVQICVKDTGKGISPEFLPDVFDRFRQEDGEKSKKHEGLGLGLAIVKQLTELHGGRVDAKSDGRGKGAAFTICLPIGELSTFHATEDSGGGEQNSKPVRLTGLKILAVDDEPDSHQFLKRMLEAAEAKVHTASSGIEAIEILKNTEIDVMLSDLAMPAIDGFELLDHVRKELGIPAEVMPAIALTAMAHEEERTRALAAGYQAHVSKPVALDRLIELISKVARR